jgi:ATP phosphoribosyltransferase regulatory subunit
MTLYPDALLRGLAATPSRLRAFVPLGASAEAAQALRAQGIATVAQLSAADTPDSLRCTHILDAAGTLRPVKE